MLTRALPPEDNCRSLTVWYGGTIVPGNMAAQHWDHGYCVVREFFTSSGSRNRKDDRSRNPN